jgi:TctA family transporter
MEEKLIMSLMMTRGNIFDILTRPLTATIFVVCITVLIAPYLIRLIKRSFSGKAT